MSFLKILRKAMGTDMYDSSSDGEETEEYDWKGDSTPLIKYTFGVDMMQLVDLESSEEHECVSKPKRLCRRVCWKGTQRQRVCGKKVYRNKMCQYHCKKQKNSY